MIKYLPLWIVAFFLCLNCSSVRKNVMKDEKSSDSTHQQVMSNPEIPKVSFKQSNVPRDIILIYCSYYNNNPKNWDKEKFKYYLAYFDKKPGENISSYPQDILFDTFLFMYYRTSRGRSVECDPKSLPTDKQDWEECADRFFDTEFQLSALDKASLEISDLLNINFRPKVILTLPYPDVRQKDFGKINENSTSLDFSKSEEMRFDAIKWYVDNTIQMWEKAKFKNLNLIGFYWFNESHINARKQMSISEKEAPHYDFELMKKTCQYIHSIKVDGKKLTLSWIPYNPYGDERIDFCKEWLNQKEEQQIDYLMIQPNYFFPKWNKTIEDLKRTIHNAESIGAGVEIEFDDKIFTEKELPDRLINYLNEVRNTGDYYQKTCIGYYQGVDTFYKLFSTDSTNWIYKEIYNFISDRRK